MSTAETEVNSTKTKNPVIAAVVAVVLTILLPYYCIFSMLGPFIMGLIPIWSGWFPIYTSYLSTITIFLIPGCFRFIFVYRYYFYFNGSISFKKLVRIGIIVQGLPFAYWMLVYRFPVIGFPIPLMVVLCLLFAKAVGGPRDTIPNTE